MLRLAPAALADLPAATPKAGFERFVRREPLGLVLVLAAWNYPYLITVNSIAEVASRVPTRTKVESPRPARLKSSWFLTERALSAPTPIRTTR